MAQHSRAKQNRIEQNRRPIHAIVASAHVPPPLPTISNRVAHPLSVPCPLIMGPYKTLPCWPFLNSTYHPILLPHCSVNKSRTGDVTSSSSCSSSSGETPSPRTNDNDNAGAATAITPRQSSVDTVLTRSFNYELHHARNIIGFVSPRVSWLLCAQVSSSPLPHRNAPHRTLILDPSYKYPNAYRRLPTPVALLASLSFRHSNDSLSLLVLTRVACCGLGSRTL